MKTLLKIFFLFFLLTNLSYSSPEIRKGNSLCRIFYNPLGKCYITFNKGLIIKEIDEISARKFLLPIEKKCNKLNNDLHSFVFPNPIINNSGYLNLNLKDDAQIKVFSYDQQNNEIMHFNGQLTRGDNNIYLNFANHQKGVNFIYIEVNGIIYLNKAFIL